VQLVGFIIRNGFPQSVVRSNQLGCRRRKLLTKTSFTI